MKTWPPILEAITTLSESSCVHGGRLVAVQLDRIAFDALCTRLRVRNVPGDSMKLAMAAGEVVVSVRGEA